MTRTRIAFALMALVTMVALAAGCGGTSEGSGGGKNQISLAAYSTPQEAYEEIIPQFKKTSEGKGVSFKQSYGASGEQERAIEGGLSTDVAALSLEPDVTKLVDAGLVDKGWKDDKYDGFVTNSVVALVTRKGNPKNIKTWDDLTRDDVDVITPNALTSGGAKWNIMAAYGSQIEQGKSDAQAQDFLKKLLSNVSVQDKSARESLQTFTGGKGDVLISYENEAIAAQQAGEDLDYVVPDETILIENPAAVVTKGKNNEGAQQFIDYLRTKPAQKIYAEKGYRSIIPSLVDKKRFPTPPKLFEIDKFGGWGDVDKKFFDDENGVVTKINEELGVSAG